MTASKPKEVQIPVNAKAGMVSGLFVKPPDAHTLLVLAHGAGAGMRHRFMEDVTAKLAVGGVATLRYQFPYMEKRIKRPDPETTLLDTVRAAITAANKLAAGLPVFAGGKSMGGRMTSLALAKTPLDLVRGLVYFGFPLHAAGKPSADRGEHLSQIDLPMLFLQGSRDALADLKLLRPLCRKLVSRAELVIVEGGDHSFHMLKSSKRSDDEVLSELAARTAEWMKQNSDR
jgi:uncharacterized protein